MLKGKSLEGSGTMQVRWDCTAPGRAGGPQGGGGQDSLGPPCSGLPACVLGQDGTLHAREGTEPLDQVRKWSGGGWGDSRG